MTDAKGDIKLNRRQFVLSGVHLASGDNELQADILAPYDFNSFDGADHAHAEITAQLIPKDLAYFLSDSLMNQFNWGTTELALEGDYSMGEGKIKTLNLKTDNSQFHAEGYVNDVMDPEKVN